MRQGSHCRGRGGAGRGGGGRGGGQVQRIREGWCCESAPGRGLLGALGDVTLWASVLDAAAVGAVLRDGAPARGPGVRLSLRFRAAGGPEPGLWGVVAQDEGPGTRDGSLVGTPRPVVHHAPPGAATGG